MRKKIDWLRLGTLAFTLLFIGSAVFFEIFELGTLPAQFFGALLGVVITAIITVLLLQGQTKNEEKREINLRVFEKKQQVYFEFLDKLNHILQDQDFRIHPSTKTLGAHNAINLQDLLFEFGYLQMHTSAVVFDQILDHIARLIEANNLLSKQIDANPSSINTYYNTLTREYFAVVALLKTELYREKEQSADFKKISGLLQHAMDKGLESKSKL